MRLIICLLSTILLTPLGIAQDQTELNVEDFFRRPSVETAILSPSGTLVAYEKFGDVYIGSQSVPFTNIYGVNSRFKIANLVWLSDTLIAIQIRKKSNGQLNSMFVELQANEQGIQLVRDEFIDNSGEIVDRLPGQPYAFLFAQYRWNEDREQVFSDVHKITLFTGKTYRFKKRNKYNANSGKIIEWITDQNSRLRAGVSYEESKPVLWNRRHEKSRKMQPIWTGDKDTYFEVYGVNGSNTKLWAVTDFQRDKRAAVIFDLETAQISDVIYEHPTRDVRSIVMSGDGESPLAVTYLDGGRLNYHFENEEAGRVFNTLQQSEPSLRHTVFNSTDDASSMLVVRYGQSNPGTLMHCTNYGNNCMDIATLHPWLDNTTLATSVVLTTPTNHETTIESFLSFPSTSNLDDPASLPLIIMPHGGPIGVFDTQYFSGEVEWLAHNGYAVLRVNYRGSGGYGRAFEQQGMQQWGRAIEDDIDAAVQDAFSRYPALNKQSVCLFGASYGGYSAIMGAIRQPEAYKCAISFAGVTDLPLLFNTRSVQNNEQLTERLKAIIGDPSTQMDELMAFSPVYNAEKLKTPLLLIHGAKDVIVDVEHTWRMSRMLDFYNIEHQREIMRTSGHSFRNTDDVKTLYEWVMPFLGTHLQN